MFHPRVPSCDSDFSTPFSQQEFERRVSLQEADCRNSLFDMYAIYWAISKKQYVILGDMVNSQENDLFLLGALFAAIEMSDSKAFSFLISTEKNRITAEGFSASDKLRMIELCHEMNSLSALNAIEQFTIADKVFTEDNIKRLVDSSASHAIAYWLNNGGDVNSPLSSGETLLQYALNTKAAVRQRVIDLLVEKGADTSILTEIDMKMAIKGRNLTLLNSYLSSIRNHEHKDALILPIINEIKTHYLPEPKTEGGCPFCLLFLSLEDKQSLQTDIIYELARDRNFTALRLIKENTDLLDEIISDILAVSIQNDSCIPQHMVYKFIELGATPCEMTNSGMHKFFGAPSIAVKNLEKGMPEHFIKFMVNRHINHSTMPIEKILTKQSKWLHQYYLQHKES